MKRKAELTIHESELLANSIRLAIRKHKEMLPDGQPEFGVDDQPPAAAQYDAIKVLQTNSQLLILSCLKRFLDDLERASAGKPTHGPFTISYSQEDVDETPDTLELTLEYESNPSSEPHILLMALYHAVLGTQADKATMTLLERLTWN